MGWDEIGYGRGLGLGLGLGLAAKRRAKREETFQGKESVRCEKKKGGIERWRSGNPEKVFGDIDMVSTLPRFCLCAFLLPRDRSGGTEKEARAERNIWHWLLRVGVLPFVLTHPHPTPFFSCAGFCFCFLGFPVVLMVIQSPRKVMVGLGVCVFFVPRLPNHGR